MGRVSRGKFGEAGNLHTESYVTGRALAMFVASLLPVVVSVALAEAPSLTPESGSQAESAAGCGVSGAEFAARIDRAIVAYAEGTPVAFEAEVHSAEALVPCLSDVLPPDVSVRLTLVLALARVVARDREGALGYMRTLPAGFVPPASLVPEGQFVAGMVAEAAAVQPASGIPFTVPPGWRVWVNGELTQDQPVGPSLIQVQHPDSSIAWTRLGGPLPATWVDAQAAGLPEFALPALDLPVAAQPSSTEFRLVRPPPSRSVVPVVATVIAGAVGLGGLGLGLANRAAFEDSATRYEDIPNLQDQSVVYTSLAVGGAAFAAGFGTWWVIAW